MFCNYVTRQSKRVQVRDNFLLALLLFYSKLSLIDFSFKKYLKFLLYSYLVCVATDFVLFAAAN